MKFDQAYNGDWIQPITQRGHFIRCCDCGLIHRLNFRVRKGKVQYQPFTDKARTRRFRKTGKGKAMACKPKGKRHGKRS